MGKNSKIGVVIPNIYQIGAAVDQNVDLELVYSVLKQDKKEYNGVLILSNKNKHNVMPYSQFLRMIRTLSSVILITFDSQTLETFMREKLGITNQMQINAVLMRYRGIITKIAQELQKTRLVFIINAKDAIKLGILAKNPQDAGLVLQRIDNPNPVSMEDIVELLTGIARIVNEVDIIYKQGLSAITNNEDSRYFIAFPSKFKQFINKIKKAEERGEIYAVEYLLPTVWTATMTTTYEDRKKNLLSYSIIVLILALTLFFPKFSVTTSFGNSTDVTMVNLWGKIITPPTVRVFDKIYDNDLKKLTVDIPTPKEFKGLDILFIPPSGGEQQSATGNQTATTNNH